MSIYVGDKPIFEPIDQAQDGKTLTFENTYNDVAEVTVFGESTQDGEPTPEAPVPIENIKSVELVSSNADGSKSATRTIDLQGHELRSLPDGTHDELLVHRDGTVELVQMVGDTDMGSNNWVLYKDITTRKIYFALFGGMVPSNARGMCDAYTWQSWMSLSEIKHGTFQNHPTLSYSYYCNNEIDTASDFKESVAGMHAYYPLATPKTIQLPPIEPLPTYHPYTVVDGNGADISARVRIFLGPTSRMIEDGGM